MISTKENHRMSVEKYFSTEKGKEAHRRATKNWELRNPEKAKETVKKYFQSEKGKEALRRANRKYREKMKQKKSTI